MKQTRDYLKSLWVTNYEPTQSDFEDFFDSYINILDDVQPRDISLYDLRILKTNGELEPGLYRIEDANDGALAGAKADWGIILRAVNSLNLTSHGWGIFKNPDFAGIGDYSGVSNETTIPAGTLRGVWHRNCIEFDFTNLIGSFSISDTVTNLTNSATGVVISIAGSTMKILSDRPDLWAITDLVDNFTGEEIVIDTNPAQLDTYDTGDIFIWDGYHYQLTDHTLVDGTDPTISPAYVQLSKTNLRVGYIEEVDKVIYDLATDIIEVRGDRLRNRVFQISLQNWQWGNPNVFNNTVLGTANTVNQRGAIFDNIIERAAEFGVKQRHLGQISGSHFISGFFEMDKYDSNYQSQLGIYSLGSNTFITNPEESDYLQLAPGYREYKANISQVGTDDPTIESSNYLTTHVPLNDTILGITITYDNIGEYLINTQGINSNLLQVILGSIQGFFYVDKPNIGSSIPIKTRDTSGSLANGLLNNTEIILRYHG
jgi:hypothetical protein